MKQRRFTGVWMISACLLLMLGSSGLQPAAAQETVELRVWDQFTSENESAAADAIYGSFMEENPNIEIVREVVQLDQMRQTANTALSSGTGPDVIFYDAGPGYAGVLAEAGLIEPLDEYADQYGWRDRIAEQSLQFASMNGQLYGLPLQVDLIGMFYNQTLMEQEGFVVPETVDELMTFCQDASAAGYIPLAFTNNPGWQAFHQFSMMTNNTIGPDALQQLLYNNEGSWDSPEITSAIETYFVEMRDAGCFYEDVNALTNDDAASLFQSGQALMYPTGSWAAQAFTPETMPDMDVQMMPFPAVEDGAGSYWVSGIGSAYFLSSASQHKDEAAKFLDYIFSPEAANQWVEDAGFLVPMTVDPADLDVSPLVERLLGELQRATAGEIELGYNIDVLAPPRFNETMQNGFQSILAGNQTPEELAAELQAAWEESWTPMAPAGTPAATPES